MQYVSVCISDKARQYDTIQFDMNWNQLKRLCVERTQCVLLLD